MRASSTPNVQDFQGGSKGKLNVQDSSYGTFQINAVHGFWDSYQSHGGIGVGPAKNDPYAFGSGTRQDYASGHYLTWDPTNGTAYH